MDDLLKQSDISSRFQEVINPNSPNPSSNPVVITSPIKAIIQNAHTCPVCGREFKSAKAVHGHMRFHPDRSWRGMSSASQESKSTKKEKKRKNGSDEVKYRVKDRSWRGMSSASQELKSTNKKKKRKNESDEVKYKVKKKNKKKAKKTSKKYVKKTKIRVQIVDLNHPKRRWRMEEVYEKPIIYEVL